MEVRNQHHTLATELPVPIEQWAALSPDSVWMLGEKLCVFYPLGMEPWFIISPAHSAVTVSLELSQSHLQIFLIFVSIGHIFSKILFQSYDTLNQWICFSHTETSTLQEVWLLKPSCNAQRCTFKIFHIKSFLRMTFFTLEIYIVTNLFRKFPIWYFLRYIHCANWLCFIRTVLISWAYK